MTGGHTQLRVEHGAAQAYTIPTDKPEAAGNLGLESGDAVIVKRSSSCEGSRADLEKSGDLLLVRRVCMRDQRPILKLCPGLSRHEVSEIAHASEQPRERLPPAVLP